MDGWLAGWWVDIAEQAGAAITLVVPGGLISGIPIAAEVYARALGESLAPTGADVTESQQQIRETFAIVAGELHVRQEAARERIAAIASTLPPYLDQTVEQRDMIETLQHQFIHLRDTTFTLTGGTQVRLGLWRGRLADVVGWSLGQVQLAS